MISWPERRPVTSGTSWRNKRSTPRSSAWLTAGTIRSASPPERSQPANRSSTESSAWMPSPSAAAALIISTKADLAAAGSPVCARTSRISPTWPIRTVASDCGGGRERPVGQGDHLGVGGGPAGAQAARRRPG